ncbi:galactose-specific lectin nattectin-like [Engraulis encrasicolus]|uniref:galactose-specific lectin nattectin-like n=1 Tax=Engraulis encrasicolus TaxID=184585 RepID=UPI002FD223C8
MKITVTLLSLLCSASGLVIPSADTTNDSTFSEELTSESTANEPAFSDGLVAQSQSSTNTSTFSAASLTSSTCPAGWEKYGERCYKFVSTLSTWAEAERFCLLLGGNLASVHSIADYHYIQGLIVTATHGAPLTWLGGSDAQQDGVWLWSDGSRFSFLHWSPGQGGVSSEACLQMNYGGGLLWNDIACSVKSPSVCARRPI